MPFPELKDTGPPDPKVSPALAPTTTHEDDRRTLGQRRINIVWEFTQSLIAGFVVMAVLYVSTRMVVAALDGTASQHQIANANLAFGFLIGIANLVIGFYFGRTNHNRVGGIGSKSETEGR